MVDKLLYILTGQEKAWLKKIRLYDRALVNFWWVRVAGVFKSKEVSLTQKCLYPFYLIFGDNKAKDEVSGIEHKDFMQSYSIVYRGVRFSFLLIAWGVLVFFIILKWADIREFFVNIFPDITVYPYLYGYKPFAFFLSSMVLGLFLVCLASFSKRYRLLLEPYIRHIILVYLVCFYNMTQYCHVASIGGQSIWWRPSWLKEEDIEHIGYINYLPESFVYIGDQIFEFVLLLEQGILFELVCFRCLLV